MTRKNQPNIETIDRSGVERIVEAKMVDNDDRRDGIALVNVLEPEQFAKEHIPESINIPEGQEDEFEARFDKDKPIVVYCASRQCDASPKAARALADRGFAQIRDYEAGLASWKEAGLAVAGAAR